MEKFSSRSRKSGWSLCIWPGLARLWLHGDLWGLLTAILFAVLLQSVLTSVLVWPEIVSVGSRWVLIGVTGFFWIASVVQTRRRLPFLLGQRHATEADVLFRAAQTEYLQGDWERAERTVRRILNVDDADVEARLLLATLLRRAGRCSESCMQLDEIKRFDVSGKWQFETQREREQSRRKTGFETTDDPIVSGKAA